MTKEDPVYSLAKSLFLKRSTAEFLNEKNEKHFKAVMKSSVDIAKMFIEVYEEEMKK